MSAIQQALIALAAAVGGGGSGTTWNPSDKGANVTLSNGNLTGTALASIGDCVRGTTSHSTTGKYYFEVKHDTVTGSNSPYSGVAKSSVNLDIGTPYGAANQWTLGKNNIVWGNGTHKSSGVTLANGDIVGIAVDFATGKIWFAKNNTWILSGDPGAGTNATWSTISGTVFPFVILYSNAYATAAFTGTTYSPPSGFSEW